MYVRVNDENGNKSLAQIADELGVTIFTYPEGLEPTMVPRVRVRFNGRTDPKSMGPSFPSPGVFNAGAVYEVSYARIGDWFTEISIAGDESSYNSAAFPLQDGGSVVDHLLSSL